MIRGRMLRGLASNVVGKGLSVGVWFLITPFVVRSLGATGYGLWVLVGSIASYGLLLDLGIAGAVVKYVAEHVARDRFDEARRVVATSLWLYLGLGVLGLALGLALAPAFPELVRVPAGAEAEARTLVQLTALTIGIAIAFNPTTAVLLGLQRYDLYNLVVSGGSLLNAAATALVLLAGGGVVEVVAATVPVALLVRLATVALIRRVAPELGFGWGRPDRESLRRIASFGGPAFSIQIAARLHTKTDELVIGTFLPVGAVTPYALARQLSNAAHLAAEQILKLVLPLASELEARDDPARLKLLYLAGSRVTLGIFMPIALVLLVYPAEILTAWVGPGYARGAPLVVVLTVASLIGTSQWVAGSVLQGIARHRFIAFTAMGSGLANVALSLALVRPLGTLGVALGTLIPTVVEALGLVLPYAVRTLGVRPVEVARAVFLPAVVPAAPALIALVLVEQLLAPASIPGLAAAAVMGAGVYGIGYLSFGESRRERETITHLLRRIAQPATPR